ncbi:hypothetical protein FFI89_017285 [Bradyrhizobium sp. KBS0727]|uniref:hypothetical protein n=1 Tax=unclassified Bradyrhizobium TaxID=2631580 RepID=UPI00110F318C|nr:MULTISPECIES: hypothetical protein [unclassified Bradyrhizobium]QDW38742.1 hypothetical protein FFI71_017280 [Bradyrhizobium sp. KBS0725]QDW45346.1 hypothetical protein FFI89_017285 [Bradyrhizobium sp. KBS0727]
MKPLGAALPTKQTAGPDETISQVRRRYPEMNGCFDRFREEQRGAAIAAPIFSRYLSRRGPFCFSSAGNQHLTAAAHDRVVMLRGVTIAALALTFASQIDQYLSDGRYTDVALAMLRQIRHSFIG